MKYIKKNIMTVRSGYILNLCNCVSLKPCGRAEDMEKAFPGTCPYLIGRFYIPGTVFLIESNKGPTIINLFGQRYSEGPCVCVDSCDTEQDREEYFKQGLESLVEYFSGTEEVVKIAVPYKIGCEYGQGYWPRYKDILEEFETEMIDKGMSMELTMYGF